jgi:glyoxylase-like metal-dependent hydrolase (beta-lactamase superfamily II)
MTEIIPDIYQVDGIRGCHVYVIVDNGITVIDTGMGGNAKKILDTIKGLGYGPSDVKRIIITHCHMDHVGSLKALKDETKAMVMAGEADADEIEGKKPMTVPKMPLPIGLLIPLLKPFFKTKPAPVDVRLKDGDKIPVLGELIVVGLPGHSLGNIGLFSPSKKLLFSSDTLRMKGDEFIKPLNYGNEKTQSLASIKKMGSLDYEIMLSGHNDPIMAGASKKVADYADKLSKEG